MIKQYQILVILLATVSISNAQAKKYFEGIVTYKFDVVSKNEKLDAKKLENIFGNGSTLIFKEGNYYHKYDGGLTEFDMYKKEVNKAYVKERGNDTIFWYDCGLVGSKIEKFLFVAKKEKILGISCDELTIKYSDKAERHYYNSDSLPINPDWFKRFTLDGENIIDQREKSIFLKRQLDYPYLLFTEVAVKIARQRVDNKIAENFQIH
jgi:hypothetical protein